MKERRMRGKGRKRCTFVLATFPDFIQNPKIVNHLVPHNKPRYHGKVLLSSIRLNGHTLGIDPQTPNKSHFIHLNKQHRRKVLHSSFRLNGHTLGSHPQTQS